MRPILAFLGGVVLAYFVDPDRGRRRRIIARDRVTAFVRRGLWNSSRMGRRAAGGAYGAFHEMAHGPDIREALDDATLARKVESDLFRDPPVPRGSINVNVEDGVVVLRGEVERSTTILEIEDAVRRIPDVLDVQNLLHHPGEPAPNKAEAISAEKPPSPVRTRPSKRASEAAENPPQDVSNHDTERPAA